MTTLFDVTKKTLVTTLAATVCLADYAAATGFLPPANYNPCKANCTVSPNGVLLAEVLGGPLLAVVGVLGAVAAGFFVKKHCCKPSATEQAEAQPLDPSAAA